MGVLTELGKEERWHYLHVTQKKADITSLGNLPRGTGLEAQVPTLQNHTAQVLTRVSRGKNQVTPLSIFTAWQSSDGTGGLEQYLWGRQ